MFHSYFCNLVIYIYIVVKECYYGRRFEIIPSCNIENQWYNQTDYG